MALLVIRWDSDTTAVQVLFAMLVVATFLAVRWLDAHDSPDLDIALALHFLVSCLGVFYILEQPFQNGDKLRYPTGATCDIHLLYNKLIRWVFWLGVLAFKFWFGKGGRSIASSCDAIGMDSSA